MKIILRAASIIALCLTWGLSWGQQTLHVSFGCPAGHLDEITSELAPSTYEIWLYDDTNPPKDWDAARILAAGQTLRDQPGHLATFRSEAEEICVLAQAAAVQTSPGVPLDENQQLWIGLVQDVSGGNEGDWGWVTGEDFTTYPANWGLNEPNDTSPGEDHGTIGRYGYTVDDGWNDEAAGRGTLFGFVVEYDVAAAGLVPLDCGTPENPEPCEIQIPSADPESNTIILPTTEGVGATADVRVFLIQEDCASVSPGPGPHPDSTPGYRDVFYDGLNPLESIPVPDYLCAAKWILISSKLEGVDIFEGVVEAKFDPLDFGLPSTGCAADNLPVPDPQKADLLTYLPSTKKWDVPDAPMTSPPRSNAHMQDFTYAECGSSRMRTGSNEYYGVGLNYYYPNEVVSEALRFRTINDLDLMQEWADDARLRNVIKQGDYSKMTQKIQGAITDIGQFEFLAARKKIQDLFKKFLAASKFKNPGPQEVNEFNWQGEGIARSSHVLNMLDVYLIQ